VVANEKKLENQEKANIERSFGEDDFFEKYDMGKCFQEV
jgi:hypothetical protein